MLAHRVASMTPARPDVVDGYALCAADPYHPQRNPGGYIDFATAENHLLWDLLQRKTQAAPPLSELDSHYRASYGTAAVRASIARWLEHRAERAIPPDQLTLAAGAKAVLEMLAFTLCDAGDAVIAPTPYYPGFDHAFQWRAGVEILPLETRAEQHFHWDLDQVRHRLDTHRAGKRIRALLINSPHNPLGNAFPRAFLDALVDFTAARQLHLIVDEMYGESYFSGTEVPSALRYRAPHVHTVVGFSKDFGLSGLGVGVLHSNDAALMRTVQSLTQLCRVSNQTQALLESLLDDVAWRETLLRENRQRLSASYAIITRRLQAAGVPHTQAVGGIFVFLNLGPFLHEHSFAAERQLHRDMLEHCRINLSPGSLYHCAEPGWFRWCHAVNDAALVTGLDRLLHWLRNEPR